MRLPESNSIEWHSKRSNGRAGRRVCWILGLLGLSMMATLAVLNFDLLWNRYCMQRLERAETPDEAIGRFRSLEQGTTRWPRAREAFIAELGSARPMLTFWFFALLDTGKVSEPALVQRFGKELEEREDLARCWSHFVRWRGGADLWQRLLAVACGIVDAGGVLVGPASDNSFFRAAIAGGFLGPRQTILLNSLRPRVPVLGHLRDYAVLWFLGASPLPSATEAEVTTATLLRPAVHNAARDRCEPDSKPGKPQDPSFFARMGKLAPTVPLPGWQGEVPTVPDDGIEDGITTFSTITFTTSGSTTSLKATGSRVQWEAPATLYDGVWPRPGSDPEVWRSNLDRILEDRGSEPPRQPFELR